jgi:hypothetical protein
MAEIERETDETADRRRARAETLARVEKTCWSVRGPVIPPKTKRTLDHFCKNTVSGTPRGPGPRAWAPPARRGGGRAAAGASSRAVGPWPPCPPRVFLAGGRRAVGTLGGVVCHAPHGARPRRAPDDRRRSEARTPRSPDSRTAQHRQPGTQAHARGTAQPRSLQHRFSHIRPARARRAAPCCPDPVTGTREATRGWNTSHTHGHMDMHHAPQTFGDILPYSAYGPRPVTACSSVPRVCRLTTVCRAAATPDTLVAHLDVT